MNKIREKVINFICYGGLEKDAFNALQPVFDKMNLKIWRILSIFMTAIFGGLFLFGLGDDNPIPKMFGVNLSMFLVSGVFVFLLFYVVYEDGPFMSLLHYGLSIFMLVYGLHLSVYVLTSQQSTAYFVILIVFNIITMDSPVKVWTIDIGALFFFLISVSDHKVTDSFALKLDIRDAMIFTLLAMLLCVISVYIKCQLLYNIRRKDEKYKVDKAEASAELRKTEQKAEVLSALSADFENIMYIDLNNNRIMKCFSNMLLDDYQEDLTKISYGEYINLFIDKLVYEKDKEYVKEQFYPRGLLASIVETPVVLVRYRLVIDGETKYYESKIIPDLSSKNKFMIIMATHDIDAETRRYLEYSKTLQETEMLAVSDLLTGVKNKTAYFRTEKEYNQKIENGEKTEFAIIMCDVNNLKVTNDSLGHEAGDKLIKTACSKICSAFVHSPVYRIGGDEFVIVASGSDYEDRKANFAKLREMAARKEDGITFASGMSAFNPKTDKVFNDVFARADAEMYENKKLMKGYQ